MRVVFFGSGEFAVPSLRWLINSAHEVVAVVTQPDRLAGRGKNLQPTPVALNAVEHALPVERCEDVNEERFVAKMRGLGADIGVVIAFGQKLLGPLRSAFASECINLHASLLPKFRGAAPIPAAILAGEQSTGVTAFRLIDMMDAGPILVQRQTVIASTETAGELHERLSRIACDTLDTTLRLHVDDALPAGVPQEESQATHAPKLTKADGYLRFDETAEQLARRCRAMWPWPGARCRYVAADGRSEEIAIATATAVPSVSGGTPGTITDVLTVATAAGALEIHSLQPAGKRVMSWQDFVNGRHVRAEERMERIEGEMERRRDGERGRGGER